LNLQIPRTNAADFEVEGTCSTPVTVLVVGGVPGVIVGDY